MFTIVRTATSTVTEHRASVLPAAQLLPPVAEVTVLAKMSFPMCETSSVLSLPAASVSAAGKMDGAFETSRLLDVPATAAASGADVTCAGSPARAPGATSI